MPAEVAMVLMSLLLTLSPAHAACTLSRLSPADGSTLTARRNFTFLASTDCVTTSLTVSGFARRTPVYVSMVGADRKYQVVPSAVDWSKWTASSRSTIVWSVTAVDAAGVSARLGAIAQLDLDADGWTRSAGDTGDCDNAATVHPAVAEVCDGIDNDCSGAVDDDPIDASVWYADTDGDGFGDPTGGISACAAPVGFVATSGDCDDLNASVSPAAVEVCNNGIDEDCGGAEDLCRMEGDWPLADADARILGEEGYTSVAQSIAAAGDLNLDGYADVLVGAPGAGPSYRGAAAVVYGPITGDIAISQADALLVGDDDDQAGWSVAGGGDINQDGYPDVLVGSYNTNAGGVHDAGGTWVVYGPFSGERALTTTATLLWGETTSGEAGFSATIVGDMNGDTYDDIAIGAPGMTSTGYEAGAAYIVPGPVSADQALPNAGYMLLGEGYHDGAGYDVASAGDVNGDGLADCIIGSNTSAAAESNPNGVAWLLSYPTLWASGGSMVLTDADAKLMGEAPGDEAGHAVGGAGDANDDGYDDVIVGAFRANDEIHSGVAYLVHGPLTGSFSLSDAAARLVGEPDAYAGIAVSSAGDVNQDGQVDFLIGGSGVGGWSSFAGGAYLVLGPANGEVELVDAAARFLGEYSLDYAGMAVAGVGDTDDDGFDDLLIGAVGADAGTFDGGAAYLWGGAAR